MKKNLRIVSAAAAALLAVAPVAATVVSAPVSAAPTTNTVTNTYLNKGAKVTLTAALNTAKAASDVMTVPSTDVSDRQGYAVPKGTEVEVVNATTTENVIVKYTGSDKKTHYAVLNQSALVAQVPAKPATKPSTSDKINAGNTSVFDNAANLAVNITAVASSQATHGAISGNVVFTDAQGQAHTALLTNDENGVNFTNLVNLKTGKSPLSLNDFPAGHYRANLNGVSLNLGNAYSNKSVTITLPKNVEAVQIGDKSYLGGATFTVTADANGVVNLGTLRVKFWAYDPADLQEVHFYSVKTGNVVTSGSVDLHAVNGKLTVQSVFAALTQEYRASQLDRHHNVETLIPVNDIKAQLEKAGTKVADDGSFTAPASFSLNMSAKSNNNGATASLPVTVNVDNVTPTAAQETTKTVKIMHIATIYDKNGKATHEPALRAYNTVSVVSNPVSLKDEKGNDAGKFYKLAGKDQYIKVGNVDGTSRSLKHNSYVYKSTGKRRGKTVLKKNSSVTTYGKSFMIAGHQMYRIGENQYVKKANF